MTARPDSKPEVWVYTLHHLQSGLSFGDFCIKTNASSRGRLTDRAKNELKLDYNPPF